jgi:hypothetical protein
MFACASLYLSWQPELVYLTKLYPFAAIMQTTYTSTIVPRLASVSVNNLKGQWYKSWQSVNKISNVQMTCSVCQIYFSEAFWRKICNFIITCIVMTMITIHQRTLCTEDIWVRLERSILQDARISPQAIDAMLTGRLGSIWYHPYLSRRWLHCSEPNSVKPSSGTECQNPAFLRPL